MNSNDQVVVITGFGLFGTYNLNPSWESVKLIELPNINLIKKQIDVVYDVVDEVVPKLWEQYKPKLMIHVGVSCAAKGIVLGNVLDNLSCANSTGYSKPDAKKCFVNCETSKFSDGCKECLKTNLDIRGLCSYLNQLRQDGKLKLNAILSTNAGRYLCEYIYYTSLKFNQQNNGQVLFVHVPELNDKLDFTIENIKDELIAIIEYLTK